MSYNELTAWTILARSQKAWNCLLFIFKINSSMALLVSTNNRYQIVMWNPVY